VTGGKGEAVIEAAETVGHAMLPGLAIIDQLDSVYIPDLFSYPSIFGPTGS
jgi:hypothetical protein